LQSDLVVPKHSEESAGEIHFPRQNNLGSALSCVWDEDENVLEEAKKKEKNTTDQRNFSIFSSWGLKTKVRIIFTKHFLRS
jgi:hypothetical protein